MPSLPKPTTQLQASKVIFMAYPKISNQSDITTVFAVDSEADLAAILADPTYNEQGITAIVIDTGDVWMLDGTRHWRLLGGRRILPDDSGK